MRCLPCVVVIGAGCGRIDFDPSSNTLATNDAMTGDTVDVGVCGGARLFAHYKLDEVSGRTIRDATGNRNGTWTDAGNNDLADDVAPGHLDGGALAFGTGSSIAIPDLILPEEGTFAVWLTSTFDDTSMPSAHPMVFDTKDPRATISFAGDLASYGLRTNNISWQATYAPPADLTGWFHLAATWSASGAKLYVDGTVRASGTGDARSLEPRGMFIGTRTGLDRWWFGLIDDVRIYNEALSDAEIADVFGCP